MKLKLMSMRGSMLSKLAFGILAVGLLNSCNKEENSLNNLSAFRKDDSEAQVIDITSVDSRITWEDRVNGVDYIVKNRIELNAELTINPGVTIMFEDGAGIQANELGIIRAEGEDGNEIYFTSKSGKRNSWSGITILSNSSRNILSYCKVEHGGGANAAGTANVIIGAGSNTAMAEISNSEITASGTDGIFMSQGSQLLNFHLNKIHTNSAFPLSMSIADAGQLDNSNEYDNNGKEFIRLFGNGAGMITTLIHLNKLDEPFMISGDVVAGDGVVINSGARIFMDENANITIDGQNGNGYFKAVGTASSPITIASVANNTNWATIGFRSSDSDDNRIEYCNISGGGLGNASLGADGMITVVGNSNIVIRNSTIMNSAATGIYIQSSNSEYNSDIASANTFVNNAKGNIQID